MKTKTTKTKRKPRAAPAKTAPRRQQAGRNAYPIHKRMLLHPLGLFGFLCIGVFMAGWTYRVVAATIVTATVEAPALHAAATIGAPVSGATLQSPQIAVSGTCPQNSYVSLNVNGSFNGVSWCDSSGNYSITTSLYVGTNSLVVQAYNQTNEAGPTSAPVQVSYTPPPSSSPGGGGSGTTSTGSGTSGSNTGTSSGSGSATPDFGSSNDDATVGDTGSAAAAAAAAVPLLLTSNFQFHTFTSQQTFTWQLDLEGGKPPYNVTINWGDGQTSKLTFPGDPVFSIQHKYKIAGYYPVVVRSVDSVGQLHTTQLAALITNADGTAPFVSNTTATGGSTAPAKAGGSAPSALHLNGTMKWLLLAWPSYLIVLLMTISFWLGEKQEFVLLRMRRRVHARR